MPIDVPAHAAPVHAVVDDSTRSRASAAPPEAPALRLFTGSRPPYEYPAFTLRLGVGIGGGTPNAVAVAGYVLGDYWVWRNLGFGLESSMSSSTTLRYFSINTGDSQAAVRGRVSGRVMSGERVGLNLAFAAGIGTYSAFAIVHCNEESAPCFDGLRVRKLGHGAAFSCLAELAAYVRFRRADLLLTARAEKTGLVAVVTLGPSVALHW